MAACENLEATLPLPELGLPALAAAETPPRYFGKRNQTESLSFRVDRMLARIAVFENQIRNQTPRLSSRLGRKKFGQRTTHFPHLQKEAA